MRSYTEQARQAAKKRFNALKKLSKAGNITAEQLAEMIKLGKELDGED